MKQYQDLLKKILKDGRAKGDRTGTGTISLFGPQMEFNLNEGFPLVTTKKMYWKGIVHELIWMLSGSTNIKYLVDNGVHIWDEWADKNGELGPVYGHQWVNWGSKPKTIPQPKPCLQDSIDPTYLGVANGSNKEGSLIKKTWEGMIGRCYDKNNIEYKRYGGKGVHVCNEWLYFPNFERDSQLIVGWGLKELDPRKYVLDKDGLGNGFLYSPKHCQWVSCSGNANLKNNNIYTVENIESGEVYTFSNPTDFCKELNISDKNFSDLWTGNKNADIRYGFRLVSKKDKSAGINQIKNVVNRIKEKPDCRRLIVSAWEPNWVDYMKLPPCHCFFQFYVSNGELSCKMYQRSADMFLGVPFNIASYALLTLMVAHVTGLKPGRFIHTFGDVHIYQNHLEQVEELLSREPMNLPEVALEPVDSIFDFKYEDISLIMYQSHPAIKAKVSV